MGDDIVRLQGVRKRFGAVEAVRGLSFGIAPGKICGLLGSNGAGKSTTLRMIVGILNPDAGSISVLGGAVSDAREKLGYLPEERGLYKRMTAIESIVYAGRLKGMAAREARDRAAALLDEYGLAEARERKIEALSKGMAQKVQILSTVVHRPRLLILDEPFSGLDPINQELLEDLIRRQARDGAAVLFSTHVMQHAERLCDRIVMIARGAAIFDGTLKDAADALPRRVQLSGDGDLAALGQLASVRTISPKDGSVRDWIAELNDGADPQALLGACFERGIRLSRFDVGAPSLHGVFIELARRGEAAP